MEAGAGAEAGVLLGWGMIGVGIPGVWVGVCYAYVLNLCGSLHWHGWPT